jgi:hypothetical protein
LENLRVVAMPNRAEYVIGEPVYLRALLANAAQQGTFEIRSDWHPANSFEIQVARRGELPIRFTAGVSDVLALDIAHKVRPREIHSLRWTLCYEPRNPSGFLFEKPGVYTIDCKAQVRVNDNMRLLNLPPIEIRIVEPAPEESEVAELVLRPECAADLQAGEASDGAAHIWQTVVDRFPRSRWMPFARLLLAERELSRRLVAPEALLERYKALATEYPQWPLRDTAYYGCAQCADRSGQPVEALRWLYELQRKDPTSSYIFEGNRLFAKYVYTKGWEGRYTPWYLRE